MWEDFVQGLVWSLALASVIALGLALAPAMGAVVGEMGYWFGRGFEWIVDLPARLLARARTGR